MKTNSKFKLAPNFGIAIAIILCFCGEMRAADTNLFVITRMKAVPSVTHKGGSNENGYVGMVLKATDIITASSAGGVELTCTNGTLLQLAPGTRESGFMIDILNQGYAIIKGESGYQLRFRMIPHSTKVTPLSVGTVMSIRGTDFCLTEDVGTLEELSVLSGEVEANVVDWGLLPDEYFYNSASKSLDTLNFDYISSLGEDPLYLLGTDIPQTIIWDEYTTSEYGGGFSDPIAGLAPTHLDYLEWIPEPATMWLLALGGLALIALLRRQRG